MRTIGRGLRTILRNPLRTGLLVAVLAVSIALTLIMITVNEAFGQRLDEIRAEVGTSIDVNPAGSFRGLVGGGDPLSEEEIDQLASLDHVESVQRTLSLPYTGEALESAIDVGELGSRLAGGDGATDTASRETVWRRAAARRNRQGFGERPADHPGRRADGEPRFGDQPADRRTASESADREAHGVDRHPR